MANLTHYVVTGGAGFIGSHLVERLLAGGARVTVIDDCSTGKLENLASVAAHPSLAVHVGKVSDFQDWAELLPECAGIFHLAAAVGVELVVRSPIHTIETNLRETEVILERANHWGVPVYLASTSEVYGKSQKEVFSEMDDLLIGPPYLGRWSYACSKLMDEFLGLAYWQERKLPVTIFRLFNTVGPRQTGQYGMVLPRFIEAALQNKPLRVYGNGRQTRCFCFVGDTVEAILRLAACPDARGEVFNIGSDTEIAIVDLAKEVIAEFGASSSIEFVPYDRAYSPGFEDMLRRKPVIDKLERFTGFRPRVPLQEIIQRTAKPWPPAAIENR